jgi:putative transposase
VPLRGLLGDQVLDLLLERSRDGAGGLQLTGEGSMLGELVKAVLERALEAELPAHLGYGKHDPAGHGSGNSRNGKIGKTSAPDRGTANHRLARSPHRTRHRLPRTNRVKAAL